MTKKPIIIHGAEPFLFPGGKTGCLLVHGFTGTPWEMRPLGNFLADQGYSVLGIRLFGHGTTPQDMARADWEDWVASVEGGFAKLSSFCDEVYIMGLSMGAALTLFTGSYLPAAGLVAMAAPYELNLSSVENFVIRHAGLVSLFMPFNHKKNHGDTSGWYKPEYGEDAISYPVEPIRSAGQLMVLLENSHDLYQKIKTPTLLVYSKGDQAVSPQNGQIIFDKLTCPKDLRILEHSSHVIPVDGERERVFAWILDFLKANSPA